MSFDCPESRHPARRAASRFGTGSRSVFMILSGHDSVCSAKNVTARNPMLRRNVTAWSPIILSEFGHCYVVTARRREVHPLRVRSNLFPHFVGHFDCQPMSSYEYL